MKVLGLTTGGDSGAAIVEDGRILAAVNEERICRWKLVEGFPRNAIRDVLRIADVSPESLDSVMVAANQEPLIDELVPFEGWLNGKPTGFKAIRSFLTDKLAPYYEALPILGRGYYAIQEPTYARRRRAVRRILHEEFDIECPIQFVDHHFCHVASAYFTSGFGDAIVMSVDGGGDGLSSLVYAVRNGQWQKLNEVSAYDSLGNYYAYVTHICGFKAMKHEGKITGLAARGEPIYVNLLREFIDEADGKFHNKGRVVFREAIRRLTQRLPEGWAREDLAASIQSHCEDVMRRYVGHWVRRSGLGNVALAGGVAANVRINEEIHSVPGVECLFIHPHMGDGGLAVGAALAPCVEGIVSKTMSTEQRPIHDVYLGENLEDCEIIEALDRNDLSPEPLDGPIEEEVADLLAKGYVVARAAGRIEYGPRALGNRSILYQPTDPAVNDWLNKNLHRTEFMPFAPSVLWEERDRLFDNIEGAEHAAEFMTITFHCTPWTREHMKGVVHIDGTARPHFVRADRNAGFHRIIEAFYRRTGLPAVINTSFNMHEEPIVCSAEDCIRGFLDGNLDYLAIGQYLVKHPRGLTHVLKPVNRIDGAAALETTAQIRAVQATKSLYQLE